VVIIPSDWITKDAEIERAFAFVKQEEILKGVSFEAIIKNIIRQKPHEINQEFFDKVFGKGVVNGIEEFRQKVKEELVESFKEESDHHFIHTVNHLLTDKIKFSLPDEFLKRWVKIANKKPITDEQIEKEYPFYANELKLELIQKKINQANNIVVTRKEIEDHITTIVTNNFKRNKIDFDEKTIKENVDAILNDNEKLDRFYEKLYQDKLVAFYQSKLGVTYKEVTPEEFNKEIEEHFKNHKH
jgi:trigger factor